MSKFLTYRIGIKMPWFCEMLFKTCYKYGNYGEMEKVLNKLASFFFVLGRLMLNVEIRIIYFMH